MGRGGGRAGLEELVTDTRRAVQKLNADAAALRRAMRGSSPRDLECFGRGGRPWRAFGALGARDDGVRGDSPWQRATLLIPSAP